MQREVIFTKDGSHTIAIPQMNVTYHSVHGAIQESLHVFIEAGLKSAINVFNPCQTLQILETGFGTGLNALLTLMEGEKMNLKIHYTAIELFPLEQTKINLLNYCQQLNRKDLKPIFNQLHSCEWGKDIAITPFFSIHKMKNDLANFQITEPCDLIYFDAFAPAIQPELWTDQIFERLYNAMKAGALLVTYCSKGDVRRVMKASGFLVEKIPGPPGKREMIRAKRVE